MAYVDPPLFVANTPLTAAQLNILAGDIEETAAATAVARGDLISADGANSMGHRIALGSAGKVLTAGVDDPEWVDSTPRRNGDRSTSGSISAVGTQKVATTLTIPSTWSGGWTLQAWGVGRVIWNGTATSVNAELYESGSGMSPSTEQDVLEATSTGTFVERSFTVIGHESGITNTGLVQVGLLLVGNGTADYADAWVTCVGYYEN